jgi:hypothetical protein
MMQAKTATYHDLHDHISVEDMVACEQCNPLELTHKAWTVLGEQYALDEVIAAWREQDWGTLYASENDEEIGPATKEQAKESYEEYYEGHFDTYLTVANKTNQRGKVTCFVRPARNGGAA